jgi:hypothetical protein
MNDLKIEIQNALAAFAVGGPALIGLNGKERGSGV